MQHIYCKRCGCEEDFTPENKVVIENGQPIFFCSPKCKFYYFEEKAVEERRKKWKKSKIK